MAIAQLQRTSMSALAFPNKISTEQQSLVLVKRLLAVSVSCITYLRGIFPECAYGTRYLDDLCVKILREDKNCPGSSQLVKWMLGCYDALQKKYVSLTISLYPFFFNLHGFYNNNIFFNFMNSTVYTYVFAVTPPDYQPPGFKDGDCEGVIFEGEPMYLNVGEVPTPFHTFKVKMTTEKERVENVDSSILSPKQLKTPLQKILMDKDDLGDEQGHYINDDFDIDTKMEEQKKNPGSSELGESSFVCEEDEIMRSEESPDLSISHSQFEQLVSKTSELDVSESKTRSGKIFQNKMANGNQPVKSKENRKRSHLKSGKTVLHPFDSSSQESVSKRRKFSEPKEHI
uniref:HORMA domain-containing protein 1 n=1 Tax=Propithecus coquereli TaxID=379532 RepID=A0A2K6GP33_PROCO